MNRALKFKIDENLPLEIADSLRRANYDIFTLDTDFTDIRTYLPREHWEIIVFRLKKQSRRHIINIFKQTIPLLANHPIQHSLWIVEENRVRIKGEEEDAWSRYAFKLATGSGKTKVMSLVIAWNYFHSQRESEIQ